MARVNENAKEFFLAGQKSIGVVVVHGITSSPSYMRFIANDLNALGYSVYAVLLAGHGTVEADVGSGDKDLWVQDVARGIRYLRENGARTVFCLGHSLGGIVSLLAGEQRLCDGVITVCAPIEIFKYYRSKLFATFGKNCFYTMNKPDGIENMFRYYRVNGKGVSKLLDAIKTARDNLHQMVKPVLVIYSAEDKTVKPDSAKIIFDGVSSGVKALREITGNHHQCIVGSREQYLDEIHQFIEENS